MSISPQKSSIPAASSGKTNLLEKHTPQLYTLWKFSRPHTIIGTSLSVLGLYLITLAETGAAVSFEQTLWALGAWIACLCGNVYIVGLNQLEDVEIDRINKPHLPLASGEYSRTQALAIVSLTGLTALILSFLQGPFLFGMVGLSLAIGTAYSLPPIRLKRFPAWASLCIFTVRGVIVNLGLFLHFSDKLQGSTRIIPAVWALTLFVLVFTFAIAIFKDIPDMAGDRQYNITTFTIRLGAKAVFNLSRWVLTACYLGMVGAGIWQIPSVNAGFLIVAHLVILAWFWQRSFKVNLEDKIEIAQFYQFIWKLFFLEYLLFPIACLLA